MPWSRLAETRTGRWPSGDTPIITLLNSAVCFLAAACAAVGGVSWLLTFTPWTQFVSASRSSRRPASTCAPGTQSGVVLPPDGYVVIWRLGFGGPARLGRSELGPDGFARRNPAYSPPADQGIHQDEPEA